MDTFYRSNDACELQDNYSCINVLSFVIFQSWHQYHEYVASVFFCRLLEHTFFTKQELYDRNVV